MVAALMGLLTFEPELRGKVVVVWIDNTAAERIFFRGSGRCADHNRIAHQLWSWAFQNNVGLWFNRVQSEDNIADGPTRPLNGGFDTLAALEATFVPPVLV